MSNDLRISKQVSHLASDGYDLAAVDAAVECDLALVDAAANRLHLNVCSGITNQLSSEQFAGSTAPTDCGEPQVHVDIDGRDWLRVLIVGAEPLRLRITKAFKARAHTDSNQRKM